MRRDKKSILKKIPLISVVALLIGFLLLFLCLWFVWLPYQYRHPDYLVTDQIAPPPGTGRTALAIPNNQYQSGRSSAEVLESIRTTDPNEIDKVFLFYKSDPYLGEGCELLTLTYDREHQWGMVQYLVSQIYDKTYEAESYMSLRLTPNNYNYYFVFYNKAGERMAMVFLSDVEYLDMYSFHAALVCDGHFYSTEDVFDFSTVYSAFQRKYELYRAGDAFLVEPIP